MYEIYQNDGGEFTDAGVVDWTGHGFHVSTEDGAVNRIVERVNNSTSWDTAEPPDDVDAVVSERKVELDEQRAYSLLRTYLLSNGYAIDPIDDSEKNTHT